MSIKFFIGLVVSSMIFTSCGQKKEVTYSKHSSADNTYSVELPTSATPGRCVGDLLSFEDANSHLIITIQHINEGSIEEYIRNKDVTNDTFLMISSSLLIQHPSIKSQEETICGRLMTFICSNVWMERTIFSRLVLMCLANRR